jgi:hypothetical protein
MNFIGIDLSLTSTGISLYNKNGYKYLSFMKNYNKATKWTKLIDSYVSIHNVTYKYSDDYSENEVFKIYDYDNNMNFIVDEIKKYLVEGKTLVAIEGYSYASGNTVSLLDLIALGTILRNKIKNNIVNSEIHIYSPSSLKQGCCGLVYGWEEKGKKTITYSTRSVDGIAGGNFKKHQMLKALYDYPCDSNLSKFIKENFQELYKMSTIPSPIPDLVDSYWLLKVLLNDKIFHIKKIIKK